MKPEIEAKFLDVNFDEVRAKLRDLGAECVQPMRLMRRKNFRPATIGPSATKGWVRVRDEGDKITLAYKQLDSREIDGTQEVSVGVSDFDATVSLLCSAGLRQTSYQETRRESWVFRGVQIELDEWPWVAPFVEIEAPDADALYAVAEQLGFDSNRALHGSVEVMYIRDTR